MIKSMSSNRNRKKKRRLRLMVLIILTVVLAAVAGLSVYLTKQREKSLFERLRVKEQVKRTLCNPNADENAQRIMNFLADSYGEFVLSGQHCTDRFNRSELGVILKETGELPAVVGFDFMRYTESFKKLGGAATATEWAIEEGQDGAIITFNWHWNVPEPYLTGDRYNGFRTENTDIDLDKIMNGGDDRGYRLLMEDMNLIASELKELERSGVTVLWRPLHEASGGWFWWGDCEPESYIALYRLMYEYYTTKWQLNNLIWVWNGMDAEWYPGDDVVDLIGEDIYLEPEDDSPHTDRFETALTEYTQEYKLTALTETTPIYDPEEARRQGALWSYFGIWGGRCICKDEDMDQMSEEYLTREQLRRIYASDFTLNRSDLPDLKNYPLPGINTED